MALHQLHFLYPSASFNFCFSSKPKKLHLKQNSHQNPVYGGVICCSSAEKPRKKKGMPSRAVMSDEELCKELWEVMLVAGLPADRVPLVKELCEHGRKDLANIVRRRGYKVVRVLLSTTNLCDNHRENSSFENQERSDPQGDETSEFEETHFGSAESISSSRTYSMVDHYTVETNGTMKNDMPVQIVAETSREVHALEEEQLPSSDRVNNQARSIETNEDLASNTVFAEDKTETEIDHLKFLLHQKEMELAELKQHIEKEKQALTLLQARAQKDIGNVYRVILTKDAELRASKDKLSGLKEVQVQFCVNGETVEVAGSFNGWHKQINMNLNPPSRTVDLQVHSNFQATANTENNTIGKTKQPERTPDINQYRKQHNRENEAAREDSRQLPILKTAEQGKRSSQGEFQAIANTKNSTTGRRVATTLQAKAKWAKPNMDITNLQIYVHQPKETKQPPRSKEARHKQMEGQRVSKLWSTILWLYPGTYEIKFIVDGQWMIDPQREVATNGHITNNVLRVDR